MILRYYALEEMLAHPDGEALMEPVFRAHEEGAVVLWTPSNMFGNKGTLAMLSEFAEDTSVFSAQERAVIDRVVPWSRMLGRPGAGSMPTSSRSACGTRSSWCSSQPGCSAARASSLDGRWMVACGGRD